MLCLLFVLLSCRFSALRALSPRLCVPPRPRLLPGSCCPCPPPPPFCFAVFVAAARCSVFVFFSLCTPFVSGFRWFPAPGALGLGAVCCLFCWPPASLLAVRSCLFCVCRLALGCSLVVPPPPPPAPFVSRSFRRCLSVLGFFFIVRPRCLWLSLVSGPGCPGPWRCVLFVLLAARFCARCALSPLLCLPPGPGVLPDGCPPPPLSVSRFSSLPLGARFFFSLFDPVVSGFRWFPAPGALGLGAVCCLFCWPPASRLAMRSRLFCVCCLAVGCSLVFAAPPPPPFCVSQFSSLPLGARFFFFFSFFFLFCVRPRCLRLFLVSGPGCPGPWRCVLFVPGAAGCGVLRCASSGVLWCGAAVCGLFCAVSGVVWRACVWLGSCAVLWWVLVCCFCCALLSCVAAFSAGFFVFFLALFLAFPWCSGLFRFLCSACGVRCQCACGVALCALPSCPCGAGWCLVLLSVVFACLLLGLAVLCCLLVVKRYPEPMAHGPEACEPSHPCGSR